MTQNIYEDGEIKILLEGKTIIVMPFEPVSAIDVSESIFSKVCLASTLCSAIVFETFNAQGTNIVIKNEKSVFSSHIIPRFDNDGLNFLWKPKNLEEKEISSLKDKISDELFKLDKKPDKVEPKLKKEVISDINGENPVEEFQESIDNKEVSNEEIKTEKKPINYILRSLLRKP